MKENTLEYGYYLKGMCDAVDVTKMTDDFLLIHLMEALQEWDSREVEHELLEHIDIESLYNLKYLAEDVHCIIGKKIYKHEENERDLKEFTEILADIFEEEGIDDPDMPEPTEKQIKQAFKKAKKIQKKIQKKRQVGVPF